MNETVYKTFDELPMFLNVATVAKLFGISQSSGYELMHEKEFPSITVLKSKRNGSYIKYE